MINFYRYGKPDGLYDFLEILDSGHLVLGSGFWVMVQGASCMVLAGQNIELMT